MPRTDPAQRPPRLTLPRGLRVRLLQLPGSSQAAALMRVHGGAHDAPESYPGLAHFLEHLLFLGSRNYSLEEGLMPFVQANGGQLNASTRERHTDYFFQMSADKLEEGLARLQDMLAQPLLDPSMQLREREVLQAEYLARAQDAETLCDAALGRAFDSTHPFSGFHAGNRDTLPVEDEQFQQALLDYHERFYQGGQIELLLAGPQDETELQRLAVLADDTFASAPSLIREARPLHCRRDAWLRLQVNGGQPRLHLAFALDGMPEHCVPALDHLSVWIACEAPGGLAHRLRREGLGQSLKLRKPYWYAGQGVAVIEVSLSERGLAERAVVVAAVFDWLRFFSGEERWQPCREEYLRIRRRSLQASEPLARLQHWVEPLAWSDTSDEEATRQALRALLVRMIESGPLVLTADTADCDPIETEGFPLRLAFEPPRQAAPIEWRWRLPAPNPWLRASSPRYTTATLTPALRWLGPEDKGGQAALFLRWQFNHGEPPAGLWYVLSHALQSRAWAAQEAGVELRFEDFGQSWSLSLSGFAEALPVIINDLSLLLVEPAPESFEQGAQLALRAQGLDGDEMLIRQLIKRLPRLLAGLALSDDAPALSQSLLLRYWQAAQWQGLAVGFAADASGPLNDALKTLPGVPMTTSAGPAACVAGHRWHDVSGGKPMAETAILLFCPLPERDISCEASWRVLGRLLEGDFYRRLRSELQLGYAVFSRFCQFGSHPGILFAVQSPTATASEILQEVQTFLGDFAAKLPHLPADTVGRSAHELSIQHVAGAADLRARAEQAWQLCLAGHDPGYATRVAGAMHNLHPADVEEALDALRGCAGGWVVVANSVVEDSL